ncbi:MAG: molybdopterin guanine dinucleotide synthesis [Yoonia sp.]|uniref:molybdopterin guanine dinucleotide synthesis n=2 Tax=Yoonia sp. TaxID=2212373 RepID=UPI00329890D8
MTYDSFVMVDWSGGNDRGAKPTSDAIWVGISRGDTSENPMYFRNRQVFAIWARGFIETELAAGRTAMIGFDFPFGYPTGFGQHLTGTNDPLAIWDWFADRVEDTPKANNRFDLAGQINATLPGIGPFWGNGLGRDIDHLPRKGLARTQNPFPERRAVEHLAKGAFTCWQLSGAGAVGSQIIMGLPVLQKLRLAFPDQINVWPFENLTAPISFVEIWPTLFAGQGPDHIIKDAHQVMATAHHLAQRTVTQLHADLHISAPVEGWILGVRDPHL